MGTQSRLKKPRVVLDTKRVVSGLLFERGQLAWLRRDWQSGIFTPLVSRDTVTELIRVLSYRKFKLERAEQKALLADFLPHTETVLVHAKPPKLPQLRDASDTMFLALAKAALADALVSGDSDILDVRKTFSEVPIMTVAEFADWFPEN